MKIVLSREERKTARSLLSSSELRGMITTWSEALEKDFLDRVITVSIECKIAKDPIFKVSYETAIERGKKEALSELCGRE